MVGEPESLHVNEPLKARVERHDYDRLLMLSDGVFAIAITLLALDLRLPERWDGGLAQLVNATGRPLIGYLFGFGLVGAFWLMHRRIFAQLAQVDIVTTVLNLLLLGMVGLTPYIARMIAEAGPGRAIPFYLVAVGGVLGTNALIRLWGSARPRLLHRGVKRSTWAIDGGFLAAAAVILAGLGAWSIVHHAAVPANGFAAVIVALAVGKQFVRRRGGRQRSSTSRP
jgi:uncharacterized membrane protein